MSEVARAKTPVRTVRPLRTGISDRWTEVEDRTLRWLDAGACAVLVVDPPLRTATAFRPANGIARHGIGDRVELGDVVSGRTPLLDDLLS